MAVSEQCTFENVTEVLDGNESKACEFRYCRLVYRGGTLPLLVQCHINECDWSFEEAADRTIFFLKAIYHGTGDSGRESVEATFDSIRRP
jgi:hypothetical protein